MSEPLYLKYRPQKLSELVGQEIIARTLTNAINMQRISHAYFFTGPRGCGKTSTARILAKSLNCKSGPTVSPCGQCQNCLEIAQGISPDVIEIDAASHRSVEDAAQVIERCHLAPQTAKYKIYIFDEVHMLSKEAFNALLKTIEEPPENVVFILATTEENKVPATIVSRCQRFAFRPIDQDPLLVSLKNIAELEKIKLTENAFLRIVKQSKGGLRDALSLLDQVSILAPPGETVDEKIILDLFGAVSDDSLGAFLEVLLKQDSQASLEKVNVFLNAGVDPLLLLRNLIEFSVDKLEREIVAGQKPQILIATLERLIESEYSLRHASQPAIKLKSLILGICVPIAAAGESPQLNTLMARIDSLEAQLKNFKSSSPSSSVRETAQAQNNYSAPKQNNHSEKPAPIQAAESEKITFAERKKPEPAELPLSRGAGGNHSQQPTNHQPTEGKSMGLLNHLFTHPKITPPIKAALQAGKVFTLNETGESITLGVPNKTFFDKLNEPRKVKVIEEAIEEIIGKTLKVRFELSSETPLSVEVVHKINVQSNSVEEAQPFTPSNQPLSIESQAPTTETNDTTLPKEEKQTAELPVETNENKTAATIAPNEDEIEEIMSTASHILGAKPIK